ncbi:MAG: dihydroorotase [Proteobacteria bacterium]|nr:dihydroorotase [Pseudomonadota bacterium]
MKIVINNATVVTSSGVFRKNILIKDCVISKISDSPISERGASFVINDKDLLVFPGFLDMHTHLREPGFEYKEDIETGLRSAHYGGFIGVAVMANTNPVNDCSTVTHFMICRAKETGIPVDLYPIGAITKGLNGETLVEMGELRSAGVVAFSDDGKSVTNSEILRRAFEYAETFNMPVICHSEESYLSKDGQINEGEISLLLGLKGIPREAEILGIYRDLTIAKLTGGAIHIAHVSTKEGVELIRKFKKEGLSVTCETCPQYFTLTEKEVLGYNTFAKINPPLRTEEDRLAVIEGLRDGTIDVIASDHAPHHLDEKNCEFQNASFGMIGLETMVPLCLELVRMGILDFKDLAEKLSRRPHRILNLNSPKIKEGEPANLTIIDPHFEWEVNEKTIHSKSINTPFLNKKLQGKAKYVIKGGEAFELF